MKPWKREAISLSVAFNVMLGTATAAWAVPIPMLREVLVDHMPALGVWVVATSAGWLAARITHRLLD